MVKVKTFRIYSKSLTGVPDNEIAEFITGCEEEHLVNVTVTYIPASGKKDAQLNVIVTKLDDK